MVYFLIIIILVMITMKKIIKNARKETSLHSPHPPDWNELFLSFDSINSSFVHSSLNQSIHPRIRIHVTRSIAWSRNFYVEKIMIRLWYLVKLIWKLISLLFGSRPLCDVYRKPFGIIIGIERIKESHYFYHPCESNVC